MLRIAISFWTLAAVTGGAAVLYAAIGLAVFAG